MKNDLIDRYIYAVTRWMNQKMREDVTQELGGLIDDMLTERCGGAAPTEKDIRVVLTELGSPAELAGQYAGESKNCLIGQPYYRTYRFVLKIVLACVAFGMTVSAVIVGVMQQQVWYEILFSWLGHMWSGMLQGFAIVTILFSVFDRLGTQLGEPFNFDDLPPVPKKHETISVWESGTGIALLLVFLIVFLTAPQILCMIVPETHEFIPIFNIDLIRASWYIIVLFSLAGIVRDGMKLYERRYTKRVMITTLICDVLSAALAVWWLTRPDMISPDFTALILTLVGNANSIVTTFFAQFQSVFLGLILFALLLDAADTVCKTFKK